VAGEEERMQDAELYASSNQMQRRDASIVLAAHMPLMTWKERDSFRKDLSLFSQ
jgi:hypothetical protein